MQQVGKEWSDNGNCALMWHLASNTCIIIASRTPNYNHPPTRWFQDGGPLTHQGIFNGTKDVTSPMAWEISM